MASLVGTDNPRFVLGYTENDADARKAERDLRAFTTLMAAAAIQHPSESGLKAAAAFYADVAQLEGARSAASVNKVKGGDRIALAVTTANNVPIFDSAAGRAFWRTYRRAQEPEKKEQDAVLCLSCGKEKAPVLTGEKIQGLNNVGGNATGTSLLSFDKDSFQSLGWDQNKNAPVCAECSFAFTRGLRPPAPAQQHPADARRPGRCRVPVLVGLRQRRRIRRELV